MEGQREGGREKGEAMKHRCETLGQDDNRTGGKPDETDGLSERNRKKHKNSRLSGVTVRNCKFKRL